MDTVENLIIFLCLALFLIGLMLFLSYFKYQILELSESVSVLVDISNGDGL